jgi:hypothetical protein
MPKSVRRKSSSRSKVRKSSRKTKKVVRRKTKTQSNTQSKTQSKTQPKTQPKTQSKTQSITQSIISKYITSKELFYELDYISSKLIMFLNNNKIIYFLAQGTLLGVVKYNNLLYWDIDFDICIFDEYLFNNKLFINFLKKEKLLIKKRKDSLVYQLCKKKYEYDKCKLPTFDISILKINKKGDFNIPVPKNNKININYYDRFYNNYKYTDIFPLIQTKLKNLKVFIPNNYKKILNSQYNNYQNNIVLIFKNKNNKIHFLGEKIKIYKKKTKVYKILNNLNKNKYLF